MIRPNHQPPGNTQPRFINLRDGGNLAQQAQHMPFWMIGLALMVAFAIFGLAVEARMQASIEQAIFETQGYDQ